jgi:hypothetical protein
MVTNYSHIAATFILLTVAPVCAADSPVPATRPLGVLLGESTLAFTGWPTARGTDGPCGKAVGYWQVRQVLKGDKGLKDKVVPIYGQAPPDRGAHTTLLFLKGRADCPEFVAQQDPAAEALRRSIQEPDECHQQLQVVQRVLGGLATDCDIDDDCEAFSLHPNACERPHPYAKRAKTATPPYWEALAARARQACGPDWSKQPACAPVVMPTHCHEHRCVEGPPLGKLPRWTQGTLVESCAPTDAPAISVVVHPQGAGFPSINVNWWRKERPQRGEGGTYELVGSPAYNEGFGASYCPMAQSCQPLRSMHLRLELGADGKGELKIEGETLSGEKLDAKVPAEFGPAQRVICG